MSERDRRDLRGAFKRGIVEFIAIFLAVTLSFLADDWREELEQRDRAVGVLEGIEEDLSQDLVVMRQGLEYDSTAVPAGTWLANNWEREDLPVRFGASGPGRPAATSRRARGSSGSCAGFSTSRTMEADHR